MFTCQVSASSVLTQYTESMYNVVTKCTESTDNVETTYTQSKMSYLGASGYKDCTYFSTAGHHPQQFLSVGCTMNETISNTQLVVYMTLKWISLV